MKRSEHTCTVAGCDNTCPKPYPLCSSCWYRVPTELRRAVRAAMRNAGQDGAALYDAVARAAASVSGLGADEPAVTTVAVFDWELAYLKAGSPSLKEKGRD